MTRLATVILYFTVYCLVPAQKKPEILTNQRSLYSPLEMELQVHLKGVGLSLEKLALKFCGTCTKDTSR